VTKIAENLPDAAYRLKDHGATAAKSIENAVKYLSNAAVLITIINLFSPRHPRKVKE
jgi:hypothetical protein